MAMDGFPSNLGFYSTNAQLQMPRNKLEKWWNTLLRKWVSSRTLKKEKWVSKNLKREEERIKRVVESLSFETPKPYSPCTKRPNYPSL